LELKIIINEKKVMKKLKSEKEDSGL